MVFAACLSQSVFKNYDHDENGFISQEDFEKIAASFPFSFCVMDKEKWVFDRSRTLSELICDFRGEEAKVVFVVMSVATGNIK